MSTAGAGGPITNPSLSCIQLETSKRHLLVSGVQARWQRHMPGHLIDHCANVHKGNVHSGARTCDANGGLNRTLSIMVTGMLSQPEVSTSHIWLGAPCAQALYDALMAHTDAGDVALGDAILAFDSL